MGRINVVNEDGTPMGYDFPVNPLNEKWDRLYPPTPMPHLSKVCDGYSCAWCGRCPSGDNWEVPEEDLEVWEQYLEQVRKYHRIHNSRFLELVYGEE